MPNFISEDQIEQALLQRERLLDYVENFILFHCETNKIIAQNHQFIGVNHAFEQFKTRETLAGKLGVFWHTQGSGKSYSMIFYVRKILRRLVGDFSFVVVIVDEAHRTQYKTLAENMRAALPHASYLAFTGTPLLGRDRKTNEWFGDYVSEYTFQQSMEDGATVPLVYQKWVPQMQVQNQDLSDEFYQILEDENLDDAAQEKLEKRFATEMQVITRDDRLETIAKDIVHHFPRRGYLGKGMVIAVDKFTAVKMFDKVQWHWKAEIKTLAAHPPSSTLTIW